MSICFTRIGEYLTWKAIKYKVIKIKKMGFETLLYGCLP